jgi:uncharacterized protein YbjT (DUF2867 family)
MEILLTGASGMVGQAALAACVADARVTGVVALVRTPLGIGEGKVREVICRDLFEVATVAREIGRPDACLFCAGVSAVGKTEEEYRRTTYDLTLAVARFLVGVNPGMRFLYVTGVGTDSTEKGGTMWARVKGATENALMRMGFAGVALFRPGYIQPRGGVRSKVGWYRAIYAMIGPFYPLLRRLMPGAVTDSDTLGRAMIAAVLPGVNAGVVEPVEINRLGV